MGRGTVGGAELARGTRAAQNNRYYFMMAERERYDTEGQTPLLRLKI